MPGRPDFTTPGSGGSGQTIATMNRPELQFEETIVSTSLLAGNSETIEVYAPTGSTYDVVNADLLARAPASATTGTHTMRPQTIGGSIVTEGQSDYTQDVRFSRAFWERANGFAKPASEAAQGAAVRSMRATENQPLSVFYANNTDDSNDQDRKYRFTVSEASY